MGMIVLKHQKYLKLGLKSLKVGVIHLVSQHINGVKDTELVEMIIHKIGGIGKIGDLEVVNQAKIVGEAKKEVGVENQVDLEVCLKGAVENLFHLELVAVIHLEHSVVEVVVHVEVAEEAQNLETNLEGLIQVEKINLKKINLMKLMILMFNFQRQ